MSLREAAQQALEDMACMRDMVAHPDNLDFIDKAITALRQALEQQPDDEPVAWMHKQGNHEEPSFRQLDDEEISRGWEQYPLYTHPPQRKPLTDEEIKGIYDKWRASVPLYLNLARAVEAAHDIKQEEA